MSTTTTLFGEDAVETGENPYPLPDFYNWWAHERAGQPEGWRWVSLDCSDGAAPKGFAKAEGAVCPAGRHGLPSWKRRERGTESTIFIDLRALDAWKVVKAAETGVCVNCWGHGHVWTGWSKEGGHRYHGCILCAGTGKPLPAEVTA